MTPRILAPALLSLGTLFAGCALDEEPPLGTVTSEVISCPKFSGCGDNSPVMGEGFHELSVSPADTNAEGFTVLGFWQNGQQYSPQIEAGTRIVAWLPRTTIKLSGYQLEGGFFLIVRQPSMQYFRLYINKVTPEAVSPTRYWYRPGTARIETYELKYVAVSSSTPPTLNMKPMATDLCPIPLSLTTETERLAWPMPAQSLIFSGDRYDANTLTVTSTNPTANAAWFNIGCSGSALAKLHLMRHTTAGSVASTITSTREQRQALLKMYTGDFCGNGHRWTTQGTPLHWANQGLWTQGLASDIQGDEANESFWTENGAMCLDTYRIDEIGARSQIVADCAPNPLPYCFPSSFSLVPKASPDVWPNGALIRSLVP